MDVRALPRKIRELRSVAAVLGLLCTAAFVWHSSDAAFTATTVNPSNTFSSGTVSLGDDDSSSAFFTVTGLKPGDTGTKCVVVTFGGSLASTVKMYTTASSSSGTGGTYINLTIDEGTGGSFAGGCGSFVSGSQLYSGTLANFATASTSFTNGLGAFAPTTNGNTAVYRFVYSVQDNDSAMGLSAGLGFTWEAQNT